MLQYPFVFQLNTTCWGKRKKKDNENDKLASLSFCSLIEYHMLGEKGKKYKDTENLVEVGLFI